MDEGAEESGRGSVESNGNHAFPNHLVSSSKYINGHLYKKSKDVSMQNGNSNGNGNGFIVGGIGGAPIEYETATVSTSRIGEEGNYFHQNECKGGIPHGESAGHRSDIPNGDGIINMNGSLNGSDANHLSYNSYANKLANMVDARSSHHVNGNIDPCHNGSEVQGEISKHAIGSVNSMNESMHPQAKYEKFLGVQEVGYSGSPFHEFDKPMQENVDVGFINSMKNPGEIHFRNGNFEEAHGPSEDYHHSSQSNGTSAPTRSEQVPNGYSENKIFSNKTDNLVQMKKKKNVTFTSQDDVFSIPPGVNKEDSFGYYANGVMPNGVMSNGVMSNGVISNGVMPNGVISNGVMPNGVISNGVLSNGVMSNGGCVVEEEQQIPGGSTNVKETHGSVYTTNGNDPTGDMYNFITLKQNNHTYHPNSVNNNYIEYDMNNNGPFFPSMSSGLKSDLTGNNTFVANEVGTVGGNVNPPPGGVDISSPNGQPMQQGAYSVCSTGPHEWVYRQNSHREDQPGNVPNGDLSGQAPISENPVNQQEANPNAGGANYFTPQVPNGTGTTVNVMYNSSSYNSNVGKWKGPPLSGEPMNRGALNKNDKSATLNGKVKQTTEQYKGNVRPKNVSFSKKMVSSKSKERTKFSNYPSNVVNPSGWINQPHTLGANMLPQDGALRHVVHGGNMNSMNGVICMGGVPQRGNEMVDVKNQFVMRYLSDVEKTYQIRERIKQYENKVSKNRTNIRQASGALGRRGNSSSLLNYYNILELLYQSSVKKKNLNDRRIRTLFILKISNGGEKKKKKIYLFDATTLRRLNKQVDLYIDFVEKRQYRSDLAAQLRRWNGDQAGKPHEKETIGQGSIDVKSSDVTASEKKSNERRRNSGKARTQRGVHIQSKFIQNLLSRKSNLYCSSPVNVDQVQSENFYFQHALKQVNYLSNLLIYVHFILLKYVSIFSLSEWNALLFRDIDSFNWAKWGPSSGEAAEVKNEVKNEVAEAADTMNDAPPIVEPMVTENEKNTSSNVAENDAVTGQPGEALPDAKTTEKLNPLFINRENMIDINYYEHVIEPFDFYFYENVYNEICTYVQMSRNNGVVTEGGAASNATEQLLKNLPYQYYEFVEILNKEIMNVRDLIYRNRYIRYIFYYIYRNNNGDLLNSVNHIFQTEKKKVELYKLQMKTRYNIFLSRFFEHEYVIVKCPGREKREDEEFESCGLNFIEAKEKLFTCLFSKYREYYCAYQARVQRLREGTRRALGIPDVRFPYFRKKIAFYSEHFEDLKRRFANPVGKTLEEGDASSDESNMTHPHERHKLTFDVAYPYVEHLFNKNYALIINSEKNNSRKLKAAYIVNRNLKEKENLVIVTSVVNIIKWKSLFQSFQNVTVYLSEESILENKIETEEKNLIICVDFLPKILHVPCDVIILDMSHFNLLNRISILNDLRFLNFSRRIIILNNVLDENWSLLSSLFFLNSALFDSTIISRIQLSQSEEDKKILTNLMRSFVAYFCVINRERGDPPRSDRTGEVVTDVGRVVPPEEPTHAMNKRCFLITYMSGIQKFIYDNVSDQDKWDASVHPLLLLDESNFFLKDFNISEKFDLLKNIIKKFHMLKKRILLCYSGKDKLEKLIQILLYVHSLNDASSVSSFDVERDKDSLNIQQYDVAVVVNNHIEYLTYFENKEIACYLLISAFTKEEEGILDTFKHKKEVHFYKKKKEELMRSGKSCRDDIYRYYINNMLSENDEQFLLFNIIDQKEKVYCNTSYDEVVLPTCFVSTLAHCEEAVGYSEYWQDIKNAHSFWNFNNFNRDKVIFYLDRNNTVYDKYQNVIYYYLTNPMNEKNTFNTCLSLAIDEIIQELNRKKELDEFDEMKKLTLLNIKEKTSKKYFSSIRKVEKILSEFLNENKKKSFERFLKGCESYGQVITKCKEKLFVTFNKTYNIHFKYFEDFWLDEEKKRREKWKKLWDLHEGKAEDNKSDNPSGENNPGNGADTSGNNNDVDDLINSIFNTTVGEKNDSHDNCQASNALPDSEKTKNELNFLEKKNFRIRLSSQLFDEKEFDQLFIDRKRICLPNGDGQKEDNNSCSLEEKKEKDKKTCLYVERKEGEEPCHV
ncbi:Uncharacterized protein PCOAH_00026180 [Plasmodium coatneyi]|uniref:Uncharacterized protein n=1 Tax=Plasmodium coatneyi TaxID=208452 RepID=A0A1B1DZI0_9APIC|nr:Uncharacterized protein PCOAH_00026180 [Plasmodium coatneyi]ANQ08168.1 Uncharacterized protein PCOAH_00026180 [Plasmodium coatneyi]